MAQTKLRGFEVVPEASLHMAFVLCHIIYVAWRMRDLLRQRKNVASLGRFFPMWVTEFWWSTIEWIILLILVWNTLSLLQCGWGVVKLGIPKGRCFAHHIQICSLSLGNSVLPGRYLSVERGITPNSTSRTKVPFSFMSASFRDQHVLGTTPLFALLGQLQPSVATDKHVLMMPHSSWTSPTLMTLVFSPL